jgi:acyl-coenzyme A synthetase/AMP-(fatty) acid ligase
MTYSAESFGRHILGIRENDVCFSVPKIFFAHGFGNSITFPFSVGANTVLLAGRPEPNAVLEVIERFKPTLFFGLPTLYNALLNHSRIGSADLRQAARSSMSQDTPATTRAACATGNATPAGFSPAKALPKAAVLAPG